MTQHKDLELFAKNIRIQVLKALGELGFGHLGGAMSAADVLGVLYGGVMNVDPKNPQWEDRDYFVMSKGHAGPALYAALALKGYFPVEQRCRPARFPGGWRIPGSPRPCSPLYLRSGRCRVRWRRSSGGMRYPFRRPAIC